MVHDGGNPGSAELANAWLPGLGMLTGPFLTWVVVIRLYETVFIFKDLGLKPKEISRDEKLRRHGRRFVIGSFCVLIAGYLPLHPLDHLGSCPKIRTTRKGVVGQFEILWQCAGLAHCSDNPA